MRIEYNQKRCIGVQKCVEISPTFFSFDGEKAVLQGAKFVDEVHVLTIDCSPVQIKKIVCAGKACPVNAIKIIDEDGKKVLVDTEITQNKDGQIIKAEYDDLKEFVMDSKGYFLIRIDPQKMNIEVALCKELNKVAVTIIGKKPLEVYQTIIKHGLISRYDHAAYLGRELQKAYIALQKKIPYVQDDELRLG